MIYRIFSCLLIILLLAPPVTALETQKIGSVVFVKGEEFYFNIGETTGLRPGMKLDIYRIGAEIRDPQSGTLLGNDEEKIANGTVSFVREQISCGSVITTVTGVQVQVGDKIVAYLAESGGNDYDPATGQIIYKTEASKPDVVAEYLIEKFKAVDFAIGDFNADGRKEIAVTDGKDIMFFTYYGAKFVPYYTFKGPWNGKFLDLAAGDFNGNQSDELFVTNKPGYFTQVLVYEFNNQKNELREIFTIKDYFTTVITFNREKYLLGQKYGYTKPFTGSLIRLQWAGPKLNGKKINFPDVDAVYGFQPLDLTGDGFDEFAALDRDNYLRLYNSNGTQMYKSPGKYGGSNAAILARDRKTAGDKIDFLRTIDLDNDLKQEIIAVKNHRVIDSALFAIKSGLNPFRDSTIYGLRYRSGLIEVAWETQKLGGYTCNLEIIDINDDGRKDVLICVVDYENKGKSVLRAFDLKNLAKPKDDSAKPK